MRKGKLPLCESFLNSQPIWWGIESIKHETRKDSKMEKKLTGKATAVGGIEPTDGLSILGRENDVALIGSDLEQEALWTTSLTVVVWASFRAMVVFDQLSRDCWPWPSEWRWGGFAKRMMVVVGSNQRRVFPSLARTRCGPDRWRSGEEAVLKPTWDLGVVLIDHWGCMSPWPSRWRWIYGTSDDCWWDRTTGESIHLWQGKGYSPDRERSGQEAFWNNVGDRDSFGVLSCDCWLWPTFVQLSALIVWVTLGLLVWGREKTKEKGNDR